MGAMAAMACEGERADGPLSEESLTRRIFDSVLGKRTQRERSPSPLPAPSATPTEEVSLRKLRERSLSMLSSFAYSLVAETGSQARKPLWSTRRLAIRIFFVRFVEKRYPGSPS
ncbi:unnamed protein product [Calypogeia fissa]